MPITINGDGTITGLAEGGLDDAKIIEADLKDDAVSLAKMKAETQGGIIYYAASGAPTQLAAGTSGHFLKTQGSGANPVWAEAGGVKSRGSFMAGGSGTNQDVAHNTVVTLEFAEVFDQDGWFNDSTNIYTPQVAGYYWFSMSCWFNNYPHTDNTEMSLGTHIRKNDSVNYSTQFDGSNDWFESYTSRTSSILLEMNGSSDNVRFQVYQWNGDSGTTKLDKSESFISGFLVHAT